jgi:hypothetical protein
MTLRPIMALGIALLAAAQFALFGYFLVRTAIFSPISDMFTYIDDYLRFRAGETSLPDYLWLAHGEHHLVWIRLLTWVDVEWFHVHAIPFMVAATAAILATATLVWQQLRRAEPSLGAATRLGLLAPMLILTTANVTDCSVTINTTYPLTVFFAVLALVLFTGADEFGASAPHRRFAAVLAAIGASMGTGAGLVIWPILVWIAWRERLGLSLLVALAGWGIVYGLFYARGLYFLGPALNNGATAVSVPHLGDMLYYFFAFLGLPLSREPAFGPIGPAAGGMLFLAGSLVLLIATCSSQPVSRLDRIAVGLILLAFGSAALAAIGRSDLREGLRVPVRYTIFASALQVGLLCVVLPRMVRYFPSPRARILQCSAGLALAGMLLVMQVFIGRSAARIAAGISRDADCYAEGAGPGSKVVTRYPEEAQNVLKALRRQALLAPRLTDCVASSRT